MYSVNTTADYRRRRNCVSQQDENSPIKMMDAPNRLDGSDADLGAMMCDLETGICGPADSAGVAEASSPLQPVTFRPTQKIDVYYVTDPICSHCWALEPTLRRFLEQYGRHLDVKTVMGGLLPAWSGFADGANGIGGPADVAGHWREVGEASRMPIDGSVWLRDPLSSSYPPSRVYVVIREQDPQLAGLFLRRAREAVFAFDRNIANAAVLIELVDGLGLDGQTIVAEAESARGEELLQRDLELARELGVRGFPTLVFVDDEGRGLKVSGVRGLGDYAEALQDLIGSDSDLRLRELPSLSDVLDRDGRLFAREIEALFDIAPEALDEFTEKHLTEGSYQVGEVLGERYWQKTSEVGAAN